jgi:hypothetical protein
MSKQWFGIGLLFGLAVGSAVASAVWALRMKAELTTMHDSDKRDLDGVILAAKKQTAELMREGCEKRLELQKALDAGKTFAANTPAQADPGYTLLFEHPQSPGSSMDLLNFVRPGLGTMLGKLSAGTQKSTGTAARWVISGRVRPMGFPGDFYCWEANGELTCPEPANVSRQGQLGANGREAP